MATVESEKDLKKWFERDSLRNMVSKFNALVDELEQLKATANTQEAIDNLATHFAEVLETTTKTIHGELKDLSEELAKKIESEPPDFDIELDDTDLSVDDLNRPVSIPQQEAINAAKNEILAIAEEHLTSEEAGMEINGEDDPEVSPQVKAYVEKMVMQALASKDLKSYYQNGKLYLNTPQPGMIGYDVAGELNLGIVKPSKDVLVDPVTGRMSVPQLLKLSERIETLETTLTESYRTLLKGVQQMAKDIGNVKNLQTDDKRDLASAINEVYQIASGRSNE